MSVEFKRNDIKKWIRFGNFPSTILKNIFSVICIIMENNFRHGLYGNIWKKLRQCSLSWKVFKFKFFTPEEWDWNIFLKWSASLSHKQETVFPTSMLWKFWIKDWAVWTIQSEVSCCVDIWKKISKRILEDFFIWLWLWRNLEFS